MYSIIPVIIIVSLAIILFIIFKKFPTLSSLDVGAVEESRQNKLKEKIILERIKKKFSFLKLGILNKFKEHFFYSMKKKYLALSKMEKKMELNRFTISKLNFKSNKISNFIENGNRYLKEEDFSKAEKEFLEAIKKDSRNIEAYEGLTEVYLKTNQKSEAEEILKHILKIDENHYQSLLQLAELYKKNEIYDLAREYYLKSWKIQQNNPEVLFSLVDACYSLGYKEEALSHLKELISLDPNNPRFLDKLIKMSIELKDKGLANQALEQLRKINPHNKNIELYEKNIKKH